MKTLIFTLLFCATQIHATVVNYVISLDEPNFNESEVTAIRAKGASWEVVNTETSGERSMIDVLIDDGQISGLLNALGGYNPFVLGCWNVDGSQRGTTLVTDQNGVVTVTGTPIYPFNQTRWIALSPRLPTFDDSGNITGWTNETRVKQLHKFGGWADRLFNDGLGHWFVMCKLSLKSLFS